MVLRIWVVLILLFLFIPILLIFFYAFNTSNIQSWPIPGLTVKWFSTTWADENVRSALVVSLQAGLSATVIDYIPARHAVTGLGFAYWTPPGC